MMKKKTDFRQIKNSKKEEKEKIIILSGYSDEQLHDFINNYKKNKLPKAIFAAITKHNKNFKLKDLLKELKKEYKAVNK